jgi:hypothetical protein
MTEWLVQLKGSKIDLENLKKILEKSDPCIIQDEFGYYLKTDKWNLIEDPTQIKSDALKLIQQLDNATYLHFRDMPPISYGQLIKIDDDRKKHHFLFAEATVFNIKTRATPKFEGDFSNEQQKHDVVKLFETATKDTQVTEALRFYRIGDWINLYKSYEIMRDSIGGESKIFQNNWATKKIVGRFTQTAQSYDSIGDEARHASRKYKPHKEPMSINEAQKIIGDLLKKWIDSI